jgi:hypothetical protein
VVAGFDVIGDIHGHVRALEGLLDEMGYVQRDGAWGHAERRAIFVGDLLDRGPHQLETVRLARAMVQAGNAQMVIGNHEFNAVAYATPLPDSRGEFARRHTDKTRKQYAAFLAQVGEGSKRHRKVIEWLSSLPLWLEVSLGESRLRVVHACWHEASMEVLAPLLSPERSLTTEAVLATVVKGSPEREALDVLLKGPSVHLGGAEYVDKSDDARDRARCRWWDRDATTLRRAALVPPESLTPDGDPFPELPDEPVDGIPRYEGDVPVIVGHYWCKLPLALYSPLVACVDYTVDKGGPMVAYRWDGEQELTVDHYLAVMPANDRRR